MKGGKSKERKEVWNKNEIKLSALRKATFKKNKQTKNPNHISLKTRRALMTHAKSFVAPVIPGGWRGARYTGCHGPERG